MNVGARRPSDEDIISWLNTGQFRSLCCSGALKLHAFKVNGKENCLPFHTHFCCKWKMSIKDIIFILFLKNKLIFHDLLLFGAAFSLLVPLERPKQYSVKLRSCLTEVPQ